MYKMYDSIFHSIDTVFFWCQDRCLREVSGEKEKGKEQIVLAARGKAEEGYSEDNGNENSTVAAEGEREDEFTKFEFYKPLQFVWREFPEFSVRNTILIDDSVEKARYNPAFTSIHPPPYILSGNQNYEEGGNVDDVENTKECDGECFEKDSANATDDSFVTADKNNNCVIGTIDKDRHTSYSTASSNSKDRELHLTYGLGSYLLKLHETCQQQGGSKSDNDGGHIDVRKFLADVPYI